MSDDEAMAILCNAKWRFGLRAQGHLETVSAMFRQGKSWGQIGEAIGWAGEAVSRFYAKELLADSDFTREWYGTRWERLHQLLREEGSEELRSKACSIMANGTSGVADPPAYAQQLNAMRHRAEAAEQKLAELVCSR